MQNFEDYIKRHDKSIVYRSDGVVFSYELTTEELKELWDAAQEECVRQIKDPGCGDLGW